MHILTKFDYMQMAIAFLKLYGALSFILLTQNSYRKKSSTTWLHNAHIYISEVDFFVFSRNQEHLSLHWWGKLSYPPSASFKMLSFSSSNEVYVYCLSITYGMRFDSRTPQEKGKEKECHYTIFQNNYRKHVFQPL